MNHHAHITTLGQLKASGYRSRTVKAELRENLIRKLRVKEEVFPGIFGYDETVIPDLQRAILAGHTSTCWACAARPKPASRAC